MILIDGLLIGGLRFVLDKLVQAVDTELSDDTVLREDLLAAQMRPRAGRDHRGGVTLELEADLLQRIQEVQGGGRSPIAPMGDYEVAGVEATFTGDDHSTAKTETPVRFFGGKGGVGKTTCAAAHAWNRARRGQRVLLVSLDPAHSLGDCLAVRLGPEARAVPGSRGRLCAAEVDAPRALRAWMRRHRPLLRQLVERGTYLRADEVESFLDLMLPGVDELMGLRELLRLARARPDHGLVVDLAPTGHALRLLELPPSSASSPRILDDLQAKHRALAHALGGRFARTTRTRFIAGLEAEAEARARAAGRRGLHLGDARRDARVGGDARRAGGAARARPHASRPGGQPRDPAPPRPRARCATRRGARRHPSWPRSRRACAPGLVARPSSRSSRAAARTRCRSSAPRRGLPPPDAGRRPAAARESRAARGAAVAARCPRAGGSWCSRARAASARRRPPPRPRCGRGGVDAARAAPVLGSRRTRWPTCSRGRWTRAPFGDRHRCASWTLRPRFAERAAALPAAGSSRCWAARTAAAPASPPRSTARSRATCWSEAPPGLDELFALMEVEEALGAAGRTMISSCSTALRPAMPCACWRCPSWPLAWIQALLRVRPRRQPRRRARWSRSWSPHRRACGGCARCSRIRTATAVVAVAQPDRAVRPGDASAGEGPCAARAARDDAARQRAAHGDVPRPAGASRAGRRRRSSALKRIAGRAPEAWGAPLLGEPPRERGRSCAGPATRTAPPS